MPNGNLKFIQGLNYYQHALWEVSWILKDTANVFVDGYQNRAALSCLFGSHNEKINASYPLP